MTKTLPFILAAALVGTAMAKPDAARIKAAIELPAAAKKARKAGASEADVRKALQAAKKNKLKAGEAAKLMKASTKAMKENGKIDNFGSFVQTQLDAGLRGKELAAAIHAEHARRGMGKSKGKGKGEGKGKGVKGGPPDHAKGGGKAGKGKGGGGGPPAHSKGGGNKGGKGKGGKQ